MQATTLYKRTCLIEVEVWMLFQLIEREVVNVEFLHITIAQNDILQSLWRYAFDVKQLVDINITAKSIAVVNYRIVVSAVLSAICSPTDNFTGYRKESFGVLDFSVSDINDEAG